MTNFLKRLGKNIRFYRTIAGITQSELAKRIGVTWEMISRYERGLSNPLRKIEALSNALNVSVNDLLNKENSSLLVKESNNQNLYNFIPFLNKLPKDPSNLSSVISTCQAKIFIPFNFIEEWKGFSNLFAVSKDVLKQELIPAKFSAFLVFAINPPEKFVKKSKFFLVYTNGEYILKYTSAIDNPIAALVYVGMTPKIN